MFSRAIGTDQWRDMGKESEKCFLSKYDTLRDLVQFAQFQKREKRPWRRLTLLLLKVTLLHECYSRFLNFTNGTKPRNVTHIKILKQRQSVQAVVILLLLT